MKKILLWFLVPAMIVTSTPVYALSREDGDANTLQAVVSLLSKFIHLRYTAILLEVEDDSGGGLPGRPGGDEGVQTEAKPPIPSLPYKDEHEDGGLPFSLNKKGVFAMYTTGYVNKKMKWEIRTRGLGDVIGAKIHCKTLTGKVGGVGVTLDITSFIHDNWRHGKGQFDEPDLGNDCGWENFQQMVLALELGRGVLVIYADDGEGAAIQGDIINIGLY